MYSLQFDTDLFLWINSHHAAWADVLMWNVSKSSTWIPLYVLMAGLLWHRMGWRKALLSVLLIGAAVGLADYISSGLLKPFFTRLRPTHEPALEGLVHTVNGYEGGLYGFVSSHAANTITCALLFCCIYRNRLMCGVMALYVLLNCYSRIYLGVHYPLDILGGWIVGFVIAWLLYVLVVPYMDRAEALLHRREE